MFHCASTDNKHTCNKQYGEIIPQYCPTRKDNTRSINFRNWEFLYNDERRDVRWNIAWALRKSLRLCPCAQAIFHRISLLSSLYIYSIVQIISVQCITVTYSVVKWSAAQYSTVKCSLVQFFFFNKKNNYSWIITKLN